MSVPRLAQLPRRTFRVILADPPWRFVTFGRAEDRQDRRAGITKAPEKHYRTLTFAELCAMPVPAIAHPEGSVLALWTTGPMLAAGLAHELMRAWGYQPTTAGSWGKLSRSGKRFAFGTGFLWRGAAEMFLVGRSGRVVKRHSQAAKSVRNLLGGADLIEAKGAMIVAPLREHSRKPELLHEALETLYRGPFCELFARAARSGWSCWGNEVGKFRDGAAIVNATAGGYAITLRAS